jgi:hypothetical protein
LAVLAFNGDDTEQLSEGNLVVVNNTVDQNTGMVKLKAEFANQDAALWPAGPLAHPGRPPPAPSHHPRKSRRLSARLKMEVTLPIDYLAPRERGAKAGARGQVLRDALVVLGARRPRLGRELGGDPLEHRKARRLDAIWASASLLHVPRSSLPQILARVFNALKPGGLHFASYKGGDAEGRDPYGRYFNYLSREDVTEAYRRSRPWEVVSVTEYLGGGYDGQQGPWVAVIVRRPG